MGWGAELCDYSILRRHNRWKTEDVWCSAKCFGWIAKILPAVGTVCCGFRSRVAGVAGWLQLQRTRVACSVYYGLPTTCVAWHCLALVACVCLWRLCFGSPTYIPSKYLVWQLATGGNAKQWQPNLLPLIGLSKLGLVPSLSYGGIPQKISSPPFVVHRRRKSKMKNLVEPPTPRSTKEVSSVAYAMRTVAQLGRAPARPDSNPDRQISRCFRSVVVVKPQTQNSIKSMNFRRIQYYCIKSIFYQIRKVLLQTHEGCKMQRACLPFAFLLPNNLNTRTDPTPLLQAGASSLHFLVTYSRVSESQHSFANS
jgi:hypothetical protein